MKEQVYLFIFMLKALRYLFWNVGYSKFKNLKCTRCHKLAKDHYGHFWRLSYEGYCSPAMKGAGFKC